MGFTPKWKIINAGCEQRIEAPDSSYWYCTHHVVYKGQFFHVAANEEFPEQVDVWYGVWINDPEVFVKPLGDSDLQHLFNEWEELFPIITDEDIEHAREQAKTLLEGLE
jgi:hypothetical protein